MQKTKTSFMKQLFFIIAAFTLTTANAQKSQTIKINNSLIAVSFEVNSISSVISTKDGDSKYYTIKKYANGTTYTVGTGSGFSIGPNFEFHLSKNSRSFFFLLGAYYMQHGGKVFATQGGSNPNDPYSFFWTFYPRTSDPEIEFKMQSVRVPVSLNQYFITFGRKKNHSVGYQMGAYFDYLLNAKAGDKTAKEAVNKIYITGFAGLKYRFGRLYAHADFSVIHSKNLFDKDYAYYGKSGSGYYKETFQTVGLGFYLKK
jgi:hypothetical protein